MKKLIVSAVMSGVLIFSTAYAQGGPRPTRRHPNLARARGEVQAAVSSITKAQRANEFDLGGHAAKAKELLEQANAELKRAVEQANDNKQ